MALRLLISLLMLLAFSKIEAQSDSSKLFEKAKGTLPFPISTFSLIETYEELMRKLCEVKPSKKTSFIADSTSNVTAIFDGLIVRIEKVDSIYLVITKYGSYFLAYCGLEKPNLATGNFIKTGQIISKIQKDWDDKFRLDFYLFTKDKDMDPFLWFKK